MATGQDNTPMTSLQGGQGQCDYYSPALRREDLRCEEPKGHAGKHRVRVYVRGPEPGLDFVDEWEARAPEDERYLGEKQW